MLATVNLATLLSQMQVDPYEEDAQYNQIASYSLKLPSIERLLSQKDLQQGTSSGKQKDERYERKGRFAKIVMNSPNGTRNYTIEKERKHKENEINKTLYGYYNNGTDDLPFIKVLELLRATIKHLNQNHIEAFYKTANGRFVIVLSSEELKGIYSHELNFREQIQNKIFTFRVLPKPYSNRGQGREGTKGTKDNPNTIFVTKNLPKKAFMEFGEVHTVFVGRFKETDSKVYVTGYDIYV